MSRKLPIFYGALMLTVVNLLLRFVSTSFQVYLSAEIGAEGIGLLQLVLSVNMLAMTAGVAGIRTSTMYLTAEELGRNHAGNVRWVLSGCLTYSIIASCCISFGLYFLAPMIAQSWIGDMDALPALRTFASFLPICCLCGVMTGCFTAANRIGTLAAVEVAEQFFSMGITVLVLLTLSPGDIAGSCRAVVLGNCLGNSLTLLCLLVLHIRSKPPESPRIPVRRRILSTAVPLALADDLKAGISALENLMVPIRLAMYPLTENALATFGRISGMVFPIMMFPACILYALSELLIPELARCAAVGSRLRIQYLIRRNLRVTLFYSCICGGLLFLLAEPLCGWLYPGQEVAGYLRIFSVLVPMLYSDLIVDGMTKGLGQQQYCVRYNIISNTLDVILLYVLLPQYGIFGYFFSFLVTHLLNFILSIRRLMLTSHVRPGPTAPLLMLAAAIISVFGASHFTQPIRQIPAFLGLFLSSGYLLGVIRGSDIRWIQNLLQPQASPEKT